LVDRDAVAAFRARADELQATCTGPWPPYSFSQAPAPAHRIGADPENVAKGLGQLVLTIVELLRQLMERQALRRIDAGGLADEQIERLWTTSYRSPRWGCSRRSTASIPRAASRSRASPSRRSPARCGVTSATAPGRCARRATCRSARCRSSARARS